MKKIISLILSALIAISGVCSVTFCAYAKDSASFSVGNAECKSGSSVDIAVSIENNPGITAFRITVDYDPVILKLVNVVFKDAAQDFNTGTSQTYDSPYSISGYNAEKDINSNGQLAVLTFEINQYAENGMYDITLSYDSDDLFNMSGDSVAFDVKNGYVKVIPCQHTGGEWEYLLKETCTEDGIMIKKCAICGNEYERKIISMSEHHFGEWLIDKKPSCTENGVKSKICSVCGYGYTETIPSNGHAYANEYTVDKEPTCTQEGVKSIHCKNCDDIRNSVMIPPTGHDYDAVIIDSTCTKDGMKTYTCADCGDSYTEVISAMGHDYISSISVQPTYDKNGVRTYTCSKCGDSYTEVIPALTCNHNYEVITTDNLTCTEDGVRTYTCTKCGDSYTEIIPATGHNCSWIKDASAGKEYYKCSVCGAILDERTIAVSFKLGDVNNDGKITAADARTALRFSAKLETYNEQQRLAADVDKNGRITAADARTILRVSARLETF